MLAAADPVGDPVLLWRAAAQRAIEPRAADHAANEGLLAIGERVIFRHPLVRSAVYRSATVEDRRAAHEALAQATDREIDPDRRAWHLAAATAGPDEGVALELERSAARAQARGGMAAAAAFLQRAVALTQDPAQRPNRALAAAQAHLQAGAFDAAMQLLASAETATLDELGHARVALLRGQIAFASSYGGQASALLLKAARLPRCCCRRQSGSNRWIPRSRARPIWTPGGRHITPGGSRVELCTRSAVPLSRPPNPRPVHVRPTYCWTASPSWSPKDAPQPPPS